jgi:hypothetical protein
MGFRGVEGARNSHGSRYFCDTVTRSNELLASVLLMLRGAALFNTSQSFPQGVHDDYVGLRLQQSKGSRVC